ncbi:MAG: hypothetical protein IJ011_05615 [Clostridia bacterium]|nr:hypothetical protein [Clostridia bacterium]
MYCIKCGAHLSDGQKVCPICETRVYHPDFPVTENIDTYPKKEFSSEEFNPKGVLFVITVIAAVAMAIPLLFELTWLDRVGWSGYVAGGILLAYIVFVLPFWFKKPEPVTFTACDFAAAALFLWYINFQVEGNWFLTFALPITAVLGLIVTFEVALLKYLKKGRLYAVGGGLIALGAWTMLIELLIFVTFDVVSPVVWSSCSFVSLFLFGMMLIIIAIVKPLKDSLRKIFFVGTYNSQTRSRRK